MPSARWARGQRRDAYNRIAAASPNAAANATSWCDDTSTSFSQWTQPYRPGRPQCTALATTSGRASQAARASADGSRRAGAPSVSSGHLHRLGELAVRNELDVKLVEQRAQPRVHQRAQLGLTLAVVDRLQRGVEIAGMAGHLVDALGDLVPQDALDGLEAHPLRLEHAVGPLPVEATLEHDRRPVPQRKPLGVRQLLEQAPPHV